MDSLEIKSKNSDKLQVSQFDNDGEMEIIIDERGGDVGYIYLKVSDIEKLRDFLTYQLNKH